MLDQIRFPAASVCRVRGYRCGNGIRIAVVDFARTGLRTFLAGAHPKPRLTASARLLAAQGGTQRLLAQLRGRASKIRHRSSAARRARALVEEK
jgi:hypothetical protein